VVATQSKVASWARVLSDRLGEGGRGDQKAALWHSDQFRRWSERYLREGEREEILLSELRSRGEELKARSREGRAKDRLTELVFRDLESRSVVRQMCIVFSAVSLDRERDRDRGRQRQRERQRGRERGRETEIEGDRDRDRGRQRQRERQRGRDRDRERETERERVIHHGGVR
jgi:hypothetical protein